MLKKRYYFQQQLESHFWPGKLWNLIFSVSGKVVDNWISFQKIPIPNQLEFLAESYSQNTKQVQKITQIQHHLQLSFKISNGDQHQICSSLSNRLIPSLNFRRKLLKNKLERETDTSMKNFKKKKAQKTLLFSAANWIAFLAWKMLKFGFLYFWKSCRKLNFLSKDKNPESIEILSRKL